MASEKRTTVWLQSPGDRPHFQLQWRDEQGNRRTESTGTADPARAEELKREKETLLRLGLVKPRDGKAPLTWAEFRRQFEARYLSERSPQTRKLAAIALDKFEAAARPTSLAGVDEAALALCVAAMRKAKLAPVTQAGNLSLVRVALRWAEQERMIARAPRVAMPRVPDAGPPQRTITAAQYADLRERIAPAWRTFLDVGWYTGMRRSELSALRWSREPGCPHLDGDMVKIVFPADANKSRRYQWIQVHPDLAAILAPLRQPAGRVVGRVPTDQSYLSKMFRVAAREAGYDLKPHDLRHSFGSRYAPAVEAAVLQRLMRHNSIRTTMKYYVNVDRTLAEAILRA